MEQPTYRVKDWPLHYECAQSRKCQVMKWVAVPNKHDGKGFGRIMRHKDAGDLFSAWILIIQVASKCPDRGILADSSGPLTAEDMEFKTRFPAKCFELAFCELSKPEIGWIEKC